MRRCPLWDTSFAQQRLHALESELARRILEPSGQGQVKANSFSPPTGHSHCRSTALAFDDPVQTDPLSTPGSWGGNLSDAFSTSAKQMLNFSGG
jgi:hypothetical protein